MSKELEKKVARLFVAGFVGTRPPKIISKLIRQGLGGVVLFARNLPDIKIGMELNRELIKEAGKRPLIIALDQEGGKIQRLGPPILQLPPMRVLGKFSSPDTCKQAGTLLGRELHAMGFHLNFAPVLDVDTNPNNPIIAERAFSDDPHKVANLGIAFAKGLEQAGVGSCGKHFPGHGHTSTDSHQALPKLSLDTKRLEQVEWVPFKAAAKSGLAAIMVAHLMVPALDDQVTTFSKRVYRMLRESFCFEQLIITDDLEMKAVASHQGVVEGAVLALKAGADGVLVCHHPQLAQEAIEVVIKAVESRRIQPSLIDASNHRWDKFAETFCRPIRNPAPQRLAALFKKPERKELEKRLPHSWS